MKTQVERINVYDWRAINTNYNLSRQRSLSRGQKAVLQVAELIAAGDLTAIAAQASTDGKVNGCTVDYGEWEPAYDGRNFDGVSPELAEERDSRTVRISYVQKHKPQWIELTYTDKADADAVIAAAHEMAARYKAWESKATAA